MAPTLGWLAVFRALGAVGASAGMVIPRAVVRDLADGSSAAILMSRLVLVMGVAPILAPSIGGAVLAFAQWRVIFWILAGLRRDRLPAGLARPAGNPAAGAPHPPPAPGRTVPPLSPASCASGAS